LNAIQALSQLSYAPGRQEPKIVPRGRRKVKKTALAKPQRASILQQLFPLKKPCETTRAARKARRVFSEEAVMLGFSLRAGFDIGDHSR
jgi:hypothetical protein